MSRDISLIVHLYSVLVCCHCHHSCHMGMHCYLLPPPPVFSLTCLVECSTLLFTNGDLYIFILIAAFICISHIKSQNIFHILYIKNSFSFFCFGMARYFRHCSNLFHVESWQIQRNNSSQEEMLKCIVGIFKACCKPCRKVLLFLISAQTSSVTVLENLCFTVSCVTGSFTFAPAPKARMSLKCPELTKQLFKHSYNHLQAILAV